MLTKEQYEALRNHYRICEPVYETFRREIVDYEHANPPKPVAVPCCLCGSAANITQYGTGSPYWQCSLRTCWVSGPVGDPDAQKWNKLHGRKLPIKPSFVVTIEGNAYRTSNLLSSNCEFEGDPQDITEFLE